MDDFDPNAFLATEEPNQFDPTSFLADTPASPYADLGAGKIANAKKVNQNFKEAIKPFVPKTAYEKQAAVDPVWVNALAGLGGGMTSMYMGLKKLLGRAPTNQQVQDYRDAMEGINSTFGGMVGNAAAIIAPAVVTSGVAGLIPKVASAIGAGGATGLLANTGVQTATGALQGSLTPTKSDESQIDNIVTSGLFGGAGTVGGAGLAKAYTGTKHTLAPFFSQEASNVAAGEMANKAVGTNSKNIIDRLRMPPSDLTKQTAGQMASDLNDPNFSAILNIGNRVNPQPGVNTQLRQAAGRDEVLGAISKTPEDLANAIASRKLIYGDVLQKPVKMNADLASIMSDPYVKDILPSVRKMAQSARGGGTPLSAGEQLDAIQKELQSKVTGNGSVLLKPSDKESQAMLAVKNRLNDWMKTNIDGYSQASTDYAKASKDIFQMRGGQEVRDRLTKTLVEGAENPNALATAVNNEKSILKNAKGFGDGGLEDQFTPTNYQKINKVITELDKQATDKSLASKGMSSDAVKKAVGHAVNIPDLLNSSVSITKNAINRLFGGRSTLALKSLGEIQQDPALMAKYMERATQKEQNAMKFMLRMQNIGGQSGNLWAKEQ